MIIVLAEKSQPVNSSQKPLASIKSLRNIISSDNVMI